MNTDDYLSGKKEGWNLAVKQCKSQYNTLYEKISPAIEFRILKDSLQ